MTSHTQGMAFFFVQRHPPAARVFCDVTELGQRAKYGESVGPLAIRVLIGYPYVLQSHMIDMCVYMYIYIYIIYRLCVYVYDYMCLQNIYTYRYIVIYIYIYTYSYLMYILYMHTYRNAFLGAIHDYPFLLLNEPSDFLQPHGIGRAPGVQPTSNSCEFCSLISLKWVQWSIHFPNPCTEIEYIRIIKQSSMSTWKRYCIPDVLRMECLPTFTPQEWPKCR